MKPNIATKEKCRFKDGDVFAARFSIAKVTMDARMVNSMTWRHMGDSETSWRLSKIKVTECVRVNKSESLMTFFQERETRHSARINRM